MYPKMGIFCFLSFFFTQVHKKWKKKHEKKASQILSNTNFTMISHFMIHYTTTNLLPSTICFFFEIKIKNIWKKSLKLEKNKKLLNGAKTRNFFFSSFSQTHFVDYVKSLFDLLKNHLRKHTNLFNFILPSPIPTQPTSKQHIN